MHGFYIFFLEHLSCLYSRRKSHHRWHKRGPKASSAPQGTRCVGARSLRHEGNRAILRTCRPGRAASSTPEGFQADTSKEVTTKFRHVATGAWLRVACWRTRRVWLQDAGIQRECKADSQRPGCCPATTWFSTSSSSSLHALILVQNTLSRDNRTDQTSVPVS